MLVAPVETRLLMAVVTVAATVVSGVSAGVVHMKFGPPGRPPTVMTPASGSRCRTCRRPKAVASATPFDATQLALPLPQVHMAELVMVCVPDWLPDVLTALPPLVAETVNVLVVGTVLT